MTGSNNTKVFPILFGYDSKGGVKSWAITSTTTGFFVEHGKKDGKIQRKATVCKPKNVGRSNETSVEEQGILEAQAKWKKQIDKGYAEDLSLCFTVKNPMLAMDYLKAGHRIQYQHELGVYVQPKLDGVRCEAGLDETGMLVFKSRGGKFYPVPDHIARDLNPIFDRYPKLKLDGELYIHGEFLQDIVSAVKKPNKLTHKLAFYCFDIAGMGEGSPWYQRRTHVAALKETYTTTNVEFVRDFEVQNFEEVDQYHDMFVSNGYEGVMIRQGFGDYEYNYRSPWLQKYKKFIDEEYTIVDVEEYEGLLGKPVYMTKSGIRFSATLKGSVEEKMKLLMYKEDYIGEQGTVKYFALTKAGVPQFPVTIAIANFK